jgi:hypothetical protein
MSDTTYVKGVRLDSITLARVERHRQWMQARIGQSFGVPEGAALRDLILRGLASIEQEHAPQAPAPGEVSVKDLDYDPVRFILGKLCRRGHAWGDTGQSLLHKHNRTCVECHRAARRKRG